MNFSAAKTVTYEIPLALSLPPLTMNQRLHWTERAKRTRVVHELVGWRVRQMRVPALSQPTVTLHYRPKVNRRRDADNLVPTSKACVDALVRAGVLSDDTPAHVDHRMPVIHEPDGAARLWLEVIA